jgi:hypothetical protein
MKPQFIRRQLRRRPRRLLVIGVAFALLFAPCGVGVLRGPFAGAGSGGMPELVGFLFVGLAVIGLGLAGWSVWALRRWDRGPDVVALSRYGPPAEVLKAIDDEMIDDQALVRVGKVQKSFASLTTLAHLELRGAEVILTDSWLIHLWGEDGHRVNVMRLDDLVCASRAIDIREDGVGATLVLIDRHNARLDLAGTHAGVGRLMAEVLARVPWALERFDEETQREWQEDRTGILAELDRRRKQYRRGGGQPGDPTTPA